MKSNNQKEIMSRLSQWKRIYISYAVAELASFDEYSYIIIINDKEHKANKEILKLFLDDLNNRLKVLNSLEKSIVELRYKEQMNALDIQEKLHISESYYYIVKRKAIDKLANTLVK